ncbi:hypothetical protein C8Q76DRAFT_280906 [Earliella scabrosa]|nr:hypothetical protein C8Q76DRAFT_280906 [Earliella scabrosa]
MSCQSVVFKLFFAALRNWHDISTEELLRAALSQLFTWARRNPMPEELQGAGALNMPALLWARIPPA